MIKKIFIAVFLLISFASQAQLRDGLFHNQITPAYSWKSGWFKVNFSFPTVLATTGIDTGSAYYRLTDSTIVVWTGSQWRTLGGSGSGLTDGDKGDITVSSSGTVWTIDNLAVTNAKINDVAWPKITSTPTTIAGYGITDATLNTITTNGNFTNNEIRTGSGGFTVRNTGNSANLLSIYNVGNDNGEIEIKSISTGKDLLINHNSIGFLSGGFSQTIIPFPTPSAAVLFKQPNILVDRYYPITFRINGGSPIPADSTGLVDLGTISGGGGGNLIDGAANIGTGAEVFKDTSSNKINLRKINAGWNTKVTQNTNDISISVDTTTQILTFGTTTTWDCSLGLSAQVTLTGDGTLAITNMPNGVFLSLKVLQDGTGGRDFNAPTGTFVINGKSATTIPLTTAANSRDIWTIWRIGNEIHLNYGLDYKQ